MQPWLLWHEGALGDLLLTRFAVAALRLDRENPLVLCARNEARFLLEDFSLVQKSYPTSPGPAFWVPKIGPERVIVFGGSKLADLFAGLSVSLYTVATRPWGRGHLAIQMLLQVFSLLDKALDIEKVFKRALARERDQVGCGPFLLHPGSGGRYKCAPLEWTKALGRALKERGQEVCFILGPAERDWYPLLRDENPLCVNQDLGAVVKIIKEAKGFIGFDSGLTHLAAFLGVPTVALFGPTAWWQWCPLGPRVLVIKKYCSCLKDGHDPRGCKDPCLTHLPLGEITHLVHSFFNTTAKNPGLTGPQTHLEKLLAGAFELEEKEQFASLPWVEVVEVA